MTRNTEEMQSHIPVMLREFLEYCSPQRDERWIDGTFGYGGHAMALLERGCKVLALDWDEEAQKRAELLKEKREQFYFFRKNFSEMAEACFQIGWKDVDGILLDLGVSLGQLKDPKRGFSFHHPEAPLDMRMNQQSEKTAAVLLNNLTEEELIKLFSVVCNSKESRKLATGLVGLRSTKLIQKVGDFLEVIKKAHLFKKKGSHAATKPFLALRIAVNEELEHLERGLLEGTRLLKGGGRIAIISFHSTEDRIVKEFLRSHCVPKHRRGQGEEKQSQEMFFYKIEKILVSSEESKRNPRSRSARLRIGWKIISQGKST
ncbi:16S rRNA (cytosine(1402)-N(4))-methyltransferase RsmH [Methylacidiphilum caldifontis]|uniref:Ribosomal RNA small subunit methyltransferase H n=1 Tax=Methylacidiphilum caldifontis TaxID=2795386 RepID=A0A4Y8PFH4_9BACT|nr:16S rRNA (cytosine(1402)-N(4))-methyltransferase RsmH [Methylacidiphilum caldifontis]QSR88721.1 16S rRNA (cytosine(1402)-N(4))-methyltransferase RsmH [Methylacidiphilum caldifontis]TFE70805.1 16S rRNA (cytosine(1402)-N(4))-methyltransferase [Methylacidiphilum caldifontis]